MLDDTLDMGSSAVFVLGVVSWHRRMQAVAASGTSGIQYVALRKALMEFVGLFRQVQDFYETIEVQSQCSKTSVRLCETRSGERRV